MSVKNFVSTPRSFATAVPSTMPKSADFANRCTIGQAWLARHLWTRFCWPCQEVCMFSVKDRDRIRDRVLELAASDPRVVSGALVGSLALDQGDRWSDLDLTFAVIDGLPVLDVLDDWTRSLVV